MDFRPAVTIKTVSDAAIKRLLAAHGSIPQAARAYGVPVKLLRAEMARRRIRLRDVLDAEPDGYPVADAPRD